MLSDQPCHWDRCLETQHQALADTTRPCITDLPALLTGHFPSCLALHSQSHGDRGRRTSESRAKPPPWFWHPDHATSCLLMQPPTADREKPKPMARGFLSDPLQGPRWSCWMRLLVTMVTHSHLSCWAFWGHRWSRSLEAAVCVDGGPLGGPATDHRLGLSSELLKYIPARPYGDPHRNSLSLQPQNCCSAPSSPGLHLQHPWACDLGAGDWLILCDCPASISQADAGSRESHLRSAQWCH